jgi:uncharacterized protein (DUF1778 family)
LGAYCTHDGYAGWMPKVLQVRDVPDEVHDALCKAAHGEGLSLTKYVLRELEQVARREQVVQENAAIIRQVQASVRGNSNRDLILSILDEGRRG